MKKTEEIKKLQNAIEELSAARMNLTEIKTVEIECLKTFIEYTINRMNIYLDKTMKEYMGVNYY